MQSKQFNLTVAVLEYATECLREADFSSLQGLGFSKRAAAALEDLTLSELQMLAERIQGHVLNVALDEGAYWTVLSQVEQEKKQLSIKHELVRRDAPAEMMGELFNIGHREYTSLRRGLGPDRGAGRPPEPQPEIMDRIARAWEQLDCRGRRGEANPLQPDEWLTLIDQAGVDARTAWRYVQNAPQLQFKP